MSFWVGIKKNGERETFSTTGQPTKSRFPMFVKVCGPYSTWVTVKIAAMRKKLTKCPRF